MLGGNAVVRLARQQSQGGIFEKQHFASFLRREVKLTLFKAYRYLSK